MEQDGQHLKVKEAPSKMFEVNNDEVFFGDEIGKPYIKREGIIQIKYKMRFDKEQGKEVELDPIKMCPMYQAQKSTVRDLTFKTPYFLKLSSANMDDEFVTWEWDLNMFVAAYRKMRLKFSSFEQVAKEQAEYLFNVVNRHAPAPKMNKAEYNSKMIIALYKEGKQKKDIMDLLKVTRRQIDHRL